MSIITKSKDLAAFCARLAKADHITVDTEFMREKTYWPVLCLIQMADGEEARCIDPLADGLDLSPVYALMENPNVIKVFHAARQDLEIFYNKMGKVPAPIFDTQIAAMVCGFGDSVGYETLVRKLTKGKVDKSSRFTDWSRRPLTDKQAAYALADVTHLRDIYQALLKDLDGRGRHDWLDEEMAVLMDPATYDPDPREMWRRIKRKGNDPRTLAILREVTAWRETEVRRRDLPRNRMLRDEALLEIAFHPPRDVASLSRIRGLGRNLAEGPMGQQLLKAVQTGLDLPKDQCPVLPDPVRLPPSAAPVADLLRVVLKGRCQDADVAPKLIASSDELDLIAAFGEDADVPALRGWRRELFGEDALRVRRGEAALGVEDGNLVLRPTAN